MRAPGTAKKSRASRPHEQENSDALRCKKLKEITDVTHFGTVEGIHIDLRSEYLNPKHWWTQTLGLAESWCMRRRPAAPFIWFPWYGDFAATICARIEQEQSALARKFTPPELDQIREELTPECFVHPGDSISIRSIDGLISQDGTMLDTTEDTEVRAARLVITRKDGTKEQIEKPLCFFGRNRMSVDRSGNNFYRLRARMVEYIKTFAEGSGLDEISKENNYAVEALRIGDLIEILLEGDEQALHSKNIKEHLEAARVLDLVSHAVCFGYVWAKAEAKISVLPLAKAAKDSRLGASKGGIESGRVRREKATWRGIAERYAQRIRQEHPEWSQQKVATEILDVWKEETPSPPQHDTMEGFVAELEEAGKLPRRKKAPARVTSTSPTKPNRK